MKILDHFARLSIKETHELFFKSCSTNFLYDIFGIWIFLNETKKGLNRSESRISNIYDKPQIF